MGAVGGSLLMLLLTGWMVFVCLRSFQRYPLRKALALALPKAAILLLLLLALLDPLWGIERTDGRKARILAVLDVSSSMDVADREGAPRQTRARDLLADLARQLTAHADFETLEFDTTLRDAGRNDVSTNGVRGTDLGACLLALAQRTNLADYAGIVLFTDGGDESVRPARRPDIPLHIVGVGAESSAWNDVRIANMDAPDTVEQEIVFEIAAEIRVEGDAGFRRNAEGKRLNLRLEETTGDTNAPLETVEATVSGGSARHVFRIGSGPALGWRRFAVGTDPIAGEMGSLNNRREVAVHVARKSAHVLLFSNTASWDLAALRDALGADEGVELNAVTRVTQDRYFVTGTPPAGHPGFPAGFPHRAEDLSRYRCVILGSFPWSDFSADQRRALTDYVDGGGAVVLLGGEDSFGAAGGLPDKIAALLPWSIPDRVAPLARGAFPFGPAPGALSNPLVAATIGAFSDARRSELVALNRVGRLKPGASALFEASFEGRPVPVIAMQAYGRGIVLAVASNTLWRWRRGNESLRRAYDRFWSQAVRYLGGAVEGGRFLSVAWDHPVYRAGEEARATLRIVGRPSQADARVEGALTVDERREPLAVEPDGSSPDGFTCRLLFPKRGQYRVEFRVFADHRLLEEYARVFPIGWTANEGSAPEPDHAFLRRLAMRPADRYVTEAEAQELAQPLKNLTTRPADYRNVPVLEAFGIYLCLLLVVLVVEWTIRRGYNLF